MYMVIANIKLLWYITRREWDHLEWVGVSNARKAGSFCQVAEKSIGISIQNGQTPQTNNAHGWWNPLKVMVNRNGSVRKNKGGRSDVGCVWERVCEKVVCIPRKKERYAWEKKNMARPLLFLFSPFLFLSLFLPTNPISASIHYKNMLFATCNKRLREDVDEPEPIRRRLITKNTIHDMTLKSYMQHNDSFTDLSISKLLNHARHLVLFCYRNDLYVTQQQHAPTPSLTHYFISTPQAIQDITDIQ